MAASSSRSRARFHSTALPTPFTSPPSTAGGTLAPALPAIPFMPGPKFWRGSSCPAAATSARSGPVSSPSRTAARPPSPYATPKASTRRACSSTSTCGSCCRDRRGAAPTLVYQACILAPSLEHPAVTYGQLPPLLQRAKSANVKVHQRTHDNRPQTRGGLERETKHDRTGKTDGGASAFAASLPLQAADQHGDVDPASAHRRRPLLWHAAAGGLAYRHGHGRGAVHLRQHPLCPSGRPARLVRLYLGACPSHAGGHPASQLGHRQGLANLAG